MFQTTNQKFSVYLFFHKTRHEGQHQILFEMTCKQFLVCILYLFDSYICLHVILFHPYPIQAGKSWEDNDEKMAANIAGIRSAQISKIIQIMFAGDGLNFLEIISQMRIINRALDQKIKSPHEVSSGENPQTRNEATESQSDAAAKMI